MPMPSPSDLGWELHRCHPQRSLTRTRPCSSSRQSVGRKGAGAINGPLPAAQPHARPTSGTRDSVLLPISERSMAIWRCTAAPCTTALFS